MRCCSSLLMATLVRQGVPKILLEILPEILLESDADGVPGTGRAVSNDRVPQTAQCRAVSGKQRALRESSMFSRATGGSIMRLQVAALAAVAATSVVTVAQADSRWRDPPRGAGTEIAYTYPGDAYRVYEGTELAGFIGGGYGLGVGGRIGYAFYSG